MKEEAEEEGEEEEKSESDVNLGHIEEEEKDECLMHMNTVDMLLKKMDE